MLLTVKEEIRCEEGKMKTMKQKVNGRVNEK